MAVEDAAAPRVAVITGASSGIGRACARALAADGFAVVAAGRRLSRLCEVCEAIDAAGGSSLPVRCDVRDEASVAQLFAAATDRFVIRRSYALALFKWRGHTIPSTS